MTQLPPDSNPDGRDARRRVPRWPFVILAVLVALGIGSVWAWNRTLPYYAVSPGPVQQVEPLIEIEGTESFPDEPGDLYFLTVQLQEINVYEYLEASLDRRIEVVRREVVRPEGVTPEELRETGLEMMEESKNLATCVALLHLEYEAVCEGQGAEIAGFVEGSPASFVLEEGDVVASIAGEPVEFATDAVAVVSRFEAGDTIPMTVLREGREVSVEVTLIPHVTEPGRPMVGVLLQSLGIRFDFPFRVVIDSQNVGGPSAGLMYALGIIDRLTEGDLARGRLVAGTGTIELNGEVGAVGGVRQKVFAARAAGADAVLVPETNAEEALEAAQGEIEVVAVPRLADAIEYLESLDDLS